MFSSILKAEPFRAKPPGQPSFALILKANPYRDAEGKYTTKEKAVYQGGVASDHIASLGSLINSTGLEKAAEHLDSAAGKKILQKISTAYYKYQKHSTEAGNTPVPLKPFLDQHIDHGYLPMVEKKVTLGVTAKKSWEKINQGKALKEMDATFPDLLDQSLGGTGKEAAHASALYTAKSEALTKSYLDAGGDPDTWNKKIQAHLDKALKKVADDKEAATKAQELAQATAKTVTETAALHADPEHSKAAAAHPDHTPLGTPDATKWKHPDGEADALSQNKALGVAYYKKKQLGEDTTEAYNQWQKSKDYLKANHPKHDIPSLSLQQKKLAESGAPTKPAQPGPHASFHKAGVDFGTAAYNLKIAAHQHGTWSQEHKQAMDVFENVKANAQAAGMSKGSMAALLASATSKVKKTINGAAAVAKNKTLPSKTPATYSGDGAFQPVGGLSPDAKKAYQEHQQSQVASLTDAERDALKNYTGSGYKGQNKTVAGTAVNQSHSVKYLSSAMGKMTLGADLRLRRNMAQRWFWESLGISNFSSLTEEQAQSVVGKTYTEKAYSSTSKRLDFGSAFSGEASKTGGLALHISAPKTIRGLDLSLYGDNISSHNSEKEIILDRGVTYVIKSIKKRSNAWENQRWDVDVQAIGHQD